MKIKLWTLAWDTDAGTGASIHQSEHDANAAAVRRAATDDKELKDGEARVDATDFWEWFNDNLRGSIDSYNVDAHEIDIPVFTAREQASILHGLRMFQEQTEDPAHAEGCMMAGSDACDHFTDCSPLTVDEVDGLCERINS